MGRFSIFLIRVCKRGKENGVEIVFLDMMVENFLERY